MEWLVCKNKVSGELFVMPRNVREIMINVLTDFENGVNSIVVKTFEDCKDAEVYIAELNAADVVIKKSLE